MTTPVDADTGAPARSARTPASEIPLWSPGAATSAEPAPPIEPEWDGFEAALRAWDDLVPAELGTSEDVREAVAADLQQLDRDLQVAQSRWAAVAEKEPEASTPGESRDTPAAAESTAGSVNEALGAADAHEDRLRDLPEWQRIQTIRGAARHLWDTIKERAGAFWEKLREDARFDGWWRSLSIRVAEGIARLATAAADRLRAGAAGDLPTAEALLKLSDAAITYSTPATATAPAAPTGTQRQMKPNANVEGQSAGRSRPSPHESPAVPTGPQQSGQPDGPRPYDSRSAAVDASRGVARSFESWINTPMGRELSASTHPKVVAFREAWKRLPASDLPAGPGKAAGPYGEVAERARDLAEAAATSGRFSAAHLTVLRALSTEAGLHAGRLAVTLPGAPPGGATPAVAARPQQAQQVPRPQAAAPAPPAARGPRAGV